jgi:hypothetical protein
MTVKSQDVALLPVESGEPEIINGIEYGKPIIVDTQLWLDTDIEFYLDEFTGEQVIVERGNGTGPDGANSFYDATEACPSGWRLPLKEEFETLLASSGFTAEEQIAFLTSPDGFNAVLDENMEADFISVEPSETPDYVHSLSIRGTEVFMSETLTTDGANVFFSCRCIFLGPTFELYPINPIEITNVPFVIPAPDFTNIISYLWFIDEVEYSTERDFSAAIEEDGLHEIKLTMEMFGGAELTDSNKDVFVGEVAELEEIIETCDAEGLAVRAGGVNWWNADILTICDGKEPVSVGRGEGKGPQGENSYDDAMLSCPEGTRLPTKAELEMFIANAGYYGRQRVDFANYEGGFDAWINEEGFADYVSSDPMDADTIYGITITNEDVFLNKFPRWPVEGNYFGVRCVLKEELPPLSNEPFTFIKGEEEEIYEEINYGRPAKLNDFQVFLEKDLEFYINPQGEKVSLVAGEGPGQNGSNSWLDSLNACPNGYKLPTIEDLKLLLDSAGQTPEEKAAFFLNPAGFGAILNGKNEAVYISSSPEYESYDITVLKVTEHDAFLSSTPSDLKKETYFNTRCMQTEYFEFKINELQENDYTVEDIVTVSIDLPNMEGIFWDFANGESAETTTASTTYFSGQNGKRCLRSEVTLFGGKKVLNKIYFWVQVPDGNESDTTLDFSLLQVLPMRENAARVNSIYLSHGSAPIGTKCDGGFWTVWRNKDTNELYTFSVEPDGTPLFWEDHYMGIGYPLDLVKTPGGIFVLARDPNGRLFVFGRKKAGEILFDVTIENNGDAPTEAGPDQLIFYDENGVPVSGMEAMFNPTSARLAKARDRLAMFLAHYNYFGELKDGTRDDRQVDSFFTSDAGATEFTLGFSYGVSTSLQQHLIFDDDSYIMASLGDSEPMNIKVHRIEYDVFTEDYDAVHQRQNKLEGISKDMVDGLIVGSEDGYSTGRLGGLINMEYNKNVLIYSRRPINDQERDLVSEQDELALLFFDNQLNVLDKKVIAPGNNVNVIKCAKYGKNILLAYSVETETIWDYYLHPW